MKFYFAWAMYEVKDGHTESTQILFKQFRLKQNQKGHLYQCQSQKKAY